MAGSTVVPPVPPGKVVIDLDLFHKLVTAMETAESTLRTKARSLRTEMDELYLYDGDAVALTAQADWAQEQLPMLRRRLSLADAVDDDAGSGRPPAGLVTMDDTDLGFLTVEDARLAGEALADEMHDPQGRWTMTEAQAARLRAHAGDPDFAGGFFAMVGPAGLAALHYYLEGYGPRGVDSNVVASRPAGLHPAPMHDALARSFATFTRFSTVDDAWLGRLNIAGRTDLVETAVLTGLLAAPGPYSATFLRRLGDGLFDGGGGLDREPLHAGYYRDKAFATAPAPSYEVAVVRAVAHNPWAAPAFANQHFDDLMKVVGYTPIEGVPFGLGRDLRPMDGPVVDAVAELVAAAASQRAREVDPVGADTFVAHLAFAAYQHPGEAVSPAVRRAFGQVLDVYKNDLAHSVISLVPSTQALRTDDGTVVAEWPGDGKVWSRQNLGMPLAELPTEVWGALVQQAVLGGTGVALRIGANIEAFAQHLENASTFATRGPLEVRAHNAPFDLAYTQASVIRGFFVTQVRDVVTRRKNEINAGVSSTSPDPFLNALSEVVKAVNPVTTEKEKIPEKIIDGVWKAAVETGEAWIRQQYEERTLHGAQRRAADEIETELGALEQGFTAGPEWQHFYQSDVNDQVRIANATPLVPIQAWEPGVKDVPRLFTGDPVTDGFITRTEQDFREADPDPDTGQRLPRTDLRNLTAEQLTAYVQWLNSPAVVANHRRIPVPPSSRSGG